MQNPGSIPEINLSPCRSFRVPEKKGITQNLFAVQAVHFAAYILKIP